MRDRRGFTIIEIVVVIALIALLLGVTMYKLNPFGQFASARNKTRTFHLQAILNAIRENIGDTRTGIFTCGAGDLPSSTMRMASGGVSGTYDIAPCLVPTYIQNMPFDPATSSARYNSAFDYDTGYTVIKNASGTIILTAPAAELSSTISISR